MFSRLFNGPAALVALLCLGLPFVEFKAPPDHSGKVDGITILTGGEIKDTSIQPEIPEEVYSRDYRKIKMDAFLVVAVIFLFIIFFNAVITGRGSENSEITLSLLALVSLAMFAINLPKKVVTGFLETQLLYGFWIVGGICTLILAVNSFIIVRRRHEI